MPRRILIVRPGFSGRFQRCSDVHYRAACAWQIIRVAGEDRSAGAFDPQRVSPIVTGLEDLQVASLTDGQAGLRRDLELNRTLDARDGRRLWRCQVLPARRTLWRAGFAARPGPQHGKPHVALEFQPHQADPEWAMVGNWVHRASDPVVQGERRLVAGREAAQFVILERGCGTEPIDGLPERQRLCLLEADGPPLSIWASSLETRRSPCPFAGPRPGRLRPGVPA